MYVPRKTPKKRNDIDFSSQKHPLAAKTAADIKSAMPSTSKLDLAQDLLENAHFTKPRTPLDVLVSGIGHGLVVVLIILLPLWYTHAIDLPEFETTYLIEPPPPPPPPAAPVVAPTRHIQRLFEDGKLYAPRVVPNHITMLKEKPEQAPEVAGGASGGVIGGVAGGSFGGVPGGILSGNSASVPPPPPPKPVEHHGPIRVGGNIQAPKLIHEIQPTYPILAKETKIQGVVVLDCEIDQRGDVTHVKVVSGHPLLIGAAMDAVMQWKYQPTILDGMPVAVEMHVTVTFALNGNY